jgi:integrase
VPVDPLSDFHRPSLKGDAAGTVKAWSVAQARQFVVSAAGDRFAACWALMITRGLRRGELAGLRWSAVDLDNRRLTVKVARVVVKAKVIDSLPESGVGRTIPLDDMLVTKLRELRAVQDVEAEIAAEAYENRTDPYVMADGRGRPMHPDSISRRFDALVAKVGLPRLTVHGLRHTTATLMLSAGVPAKVVSDLLGHSSTTITNAIYSRVPPGMSEQAGEKLSSAILGRVGSL